MDTKDFLDNCLLKEASEVINYDGSSPCNTINAVYAKHKSRCTILLDSTSSRDLFQSLDIAKVADILIFLVDCRDSTHFLDEVT